jgi:hypothetical protein
LELEDKFSKKDDKQSKKRVALIRLFLLSLILTIPLVTIAMVMPLFKGIFPSFSLFLAFFVSFSFSVSMIDKAN